MNKLMGFFELQDMSLPAIPWKEYTGKEEMENNLLWTVRSAVFHGDDLNLPRLVGGTAEEAKNFADNLLKELAGKGIVIFYPYFVAKKSGTLDIRKDQVVIEAVKEDLWNLVTYSDRDVTLIFTNDGEIKTVGDTNFLSDYEVTKLTSYISEVKKLFRDDITQGKSILFEWSFAYNCDIYKKTIGNEYLVFYEARTV